MTYTPTDRRGQVSIQVWVEKKTHRLCKQRLAREGKKMKDLITKFLRWYGGTEEEEEEDAEDQTPPATG